MVGDGSSQPDLQALRVTREESRAVLDHQIAMLNDLDDKAMRTVRTAVLLLGILASAAGIAGPERLARLDFLVQIFSIVAGGCLFLSAIVGTGVYVVSDITFGIGPSYRDEVCRSEYSEREWLELLLNDYSRWTRAMREVNASNAHSLTIAQGLLAVALVMLLAATCLLTFPL